MRIEIIRPDGDLMREAWSFNLDVGYSAPCVYFNSYVSETRRTTRCKIWRRQARWYRGDNRESMLVNPPLPPDVEAEMRARYQELILSLPIVKSSFRFTSE